MFSWSCTCFTVSPRVVLRFYASSQSVHKLLIGVERRAGLINRCRPLKNKLSVKVNLNLKLFPFVFSNGIPIPTLATLLLSSSIRSSCVPCPKQDQNRNTMNTVRRRRQWRDQRAVVLIGAFGATQRSTASQRTIFSCPLETPWPCMRSTGVAAAWTMDWVATIRIWFRIAAIVTVTGTVAFRRTVAIVPCRMSTAPMAVQTQTVWVGWCPVAGGICRKSNDPWPGEWSNECCTESALLTLVLYIF